MLTSNSLQRTTAPAAAWTGKTLAGDTHAAPLAKRIVDVSVAGISVVALAPFLILLGVMVSLDSPGHPLFVSRRLARNGRVFPCFKFRTMTAGGEVTRLGSFLRRYGLDELPQFLNVLRGDMSIVGPRPVLACECSSASECPRLRRFEIDPGMTGLWAVQEAEYPPFSSYISPDETYRHHWTPWLDVMIIARSLSAALSGRGT